MIKSFQGARKAKPKEVQLIRVRDFMTRKLVTFHAEQPMDEVIRTLIDRKISGGPVVDDKNNLIGVISEGDCLKEVVKGKYNNSPSLSGKVSEYMTRNVKTLDPEMNILEAANTFLELRLRRFPVMKDGKLLGQISQRDVMSAVQQLKNATW